MFAVYYLANLLVGFLIFFAFIKSESTEDAIIRGLLIMPFFWRILLLN